MGKVDAHALHQGGPDFNGQEVIIPGGKLVAQPGLDHGENRVLLLPVEHRRAQRTEPFTACRLEKIQVARMVNVVSHRAFGIAYPVLVAKKTGHEPSVGAASKNSTRKIHGCTNRFNGYVPQV